MSIHEILMPEPGVEAWEELVRPDRKGFYKKVYADGANGGPSATLSLQPPGFENPAHFHNTPQFQVLLDGTAGFPSHKLKPYSVHYSDTNTPYGPFLCGPAFLLGIFRPRIANQIYMSDREGRKQRDPLGRELFGSSDATDWQLAERAGPGVRCKALIMTQGTEGPAARLFDCPPGALLKCFAAKGGEYQIVLQGSIVAGNEELGPYSMRHTRGGETPRPLQAGSRGAWVLTLTFAPGN